jgi:hypothetical protein
MDRLKQFREFIEMQALEREAEVIAEEFSEELIKSNNAFDSTARHAANNIDLPHRFCDPDTSERKVLNITNNADREREWLRRLESSGYFKIIFICGDNHISSFASNIQRAGHEAHVIAEEWGKGWEMVD